MTTGLMGYVLLSMEAKDGKLRICGTAGLVAIVVASVVMPTTILADG